MSFLAEIVAKVVAALLAFWAGERQRREGNEAREDLGAARAEAETQDVISEIADERSQVATGGTAADIASRLRSRRSDASRGPRYSEEPPAG